jgi:hypothetical protein
MIIGRLLVFMINTLGNMNNTRNHIEPKISIQDLVGSVGSLVLRTYGSCRSSFGSFLFGTRCGQ